MAAISLSLDLENVHNFEAFLRALKDDKVRNGLRRQEEQLPSTVQQLVKLVDDNRFIAMAKDVAKKYVKVQKGEASVTEVKADGNEILEYLKANYPDALKALQDYGNKAEALPLPPRVAIHTDAVANAEAIANAAVWVNVAAATNIVVAAEAIVLVGVFVI